MMFTAEHEQAECLLFVVANRKPKSPSKSSHSSVKGYALLPQSFGTRHPEVVELFSVNNIRVIANAKDGFTLQPTLKDFTYDMFDIQLTHHKSVNSESFHTPPNPLLIGVEEFNREAVGSLLSKSVGSYRLWVKSRTGYISMLNDDTLGTIKHFMSGGKDIAYRQVEGGTILHFAVEKGQGHLVEQLLQCGADVNAKRLDGTTPLHIAAMNGWVKIAKTLLQHGADVNAKTEVEMEDERGVIAKRLDGMTSLHIAATKGRLEIVRMLLQYGGDVNAKTEGEIDNEKDVTPLVCAHQNGHRRVVELLMGFGANINVEFDYCPSTPSTLYLSSPEEQARGITKATILYTAALTGDFQFIKSILRYQPDVNNECNRRAFHYVLFELKDKSKDVFMEMGECGFTIDCDRFGNSVKFLSVAICVNCFHAVQKIVEAGVNVNDAYKTKSFERLKPLHMAASHAGREVIQFLIDRGADLRAESHGKFPIQCAVENNNISAVKCFIFNKAVFLNEDYLLVCAGSAEMIEFLLMNGYPLNFKREFQTALERAAHEGRIEVIEVLFKYGAHLSSECVEYTALVRYAIMQWDPEIFQAILEHIFTEDKMIKCTGILLDFRESLYSSRTIIPFDCVAQYEKCVNIFAQHFLKLKAASVCTFDDNLSFCWYANESIDKFQNKCEGETALMKSERVGGSQVSFYDILTQNLSQLAGYARNDKILKTMKDDNCVQFPIYLSLLNRQFNKGRQREELMQEGIKTCSVLFPEKRFHNLPDEIKVKVLNYMNNCDLLILNNILPTKTRSDG